MVFMLRLRNLLLQAISCQDLACQSLQKQALVRLKIQTTTSQFEKDYNAGKSAQVPTGRRIAVKGRISRKIGYDGTYISYEHAA